MSIIRLWYFGIFACTAENTESIFHAVDLLLDMLFFVGGAGFSGTRASRGFAGSAAIIVLVAAFFPGLGEMVSEVGTARIFSLF